MATIQELPAESLENIFIFLDGKSLSKMREVCKPWSNVIKEMTEKADLWQEFCNKEIPDYILEEILSFKAIPKSDPYLSWTAVYKKWCRTKMVIKAPYVIKSIPPVAKNHASITCLRLSGNWIITGHSSGHLCIWNQYSGELSQRCLCHLKTVVDIALVDLLNLGSYYGAEELPWDHHHAITISKDSYIQVISLLEKLSSSKINHLNYHSTDLTAIRVFGSYFAVCSSDNIVSLWDIKLHKKPYIHLNVTMLQKIIGPPDSLLNLGLWHNQIQCITFSGKLKRFEKSKDEWSQVSCLQKTYIRDSSHKLIVVTKSFLLRNQTVILFTSDGRMVISIGDKFNDQYYMMQSFQTLIISVALRGTIFALGGENGKLYVFHVPKTECLLQLNLSNPSFSKRLSEASITSLDIIHTTDSPVIVAGTNESIFIVKWFTETSSHKKIKQRELW